MTERDLDALFAAARTDAPLPPAGLLARVLADADAEQAVIAAVVPVPQTARPVGIWGRLAGVFGGSGALAGMMAATIAGFYIGFAQPMDGRFAVTALGGAAVELDMMPGLDALLEDAP